MTADPEAAGVACSALMRPMSFIPESKPIDDPVSYTHLDVYKRQLLLLTTHGLLHLLGFDHAEPDEKQEMFELQRQLLLTFLAGRGRR